MDGFLNLCLTWSFAVLEYFYSWCDVWRVLRWSLQLVSITGKYIAIVIFDGGLSVLMYLPVSVLVISYSCFMFPWAHASSASLARSSVKFALSVFTLFLTALFASVYSSCAAAFVALIWLLLTAPFFSFLTCTLLTVSAEIQCFLLVFLLSQNFAACAGPYLLHSGAPLDFSLL